MNLLGSHDRARILNVLCDHEFTSVAMKDRCGLRLPEEARRVAVNIFWEMSGMLRCKAENLRGWPAATILCMMSSDHLSPTRASTLRTGQAGNMMSCISVVCIIICLGYGSTTPSVMVYCSSELALACMQR